MSRILVIDDDRSVRHLIAKAFDDTDVEVVPAASAEEGLRLLNGSKPDAVLLDILLPEISGLEVFDRIRSVDTKLPVIFITSLSSSETAIKAMTLGRVRLFAQAARFDAHSRPCASSARNSAADEHPR